MIAPIPNTKKPPYLASYPKRKICVFTFSHAGKSIIKTSPHCRDKILQPLVYFVSHIMIIHGFYSGALCVTTDVDNRERARARDKKQRRRLSLKEQHENYVVALRK